MTKIGHRLKDVKFLFSCFSGGTKREICVIGYCMSSDDDDDDDAVSFFCRNKSLIIKSNL